MKKKKKSWHEKVLWGLAVLSLAAFAATFFVMIRSVYIRIRLDRILEDTSRPPPAAE